MTTGLLKMLEVIKEVGSSGAEYEIKKLEAIRAWALENCGVDFAEGDTVCIKDGYAVLEHFSDGHPNGWWPNRECLIPGATALVKSIDFNSYWRYWYADIVLDREWSVHPSLRGEGERRYWRGSALDTPEGMDPPSKYDQEHHPEGTKHTFAFDVKWLERA